MPAAPIVSAGCVLGRYQLLLPIAAGGMAMVWAARMRGTRGFQKTFAVKMMLPSMSTDPHFEQMLLDEAKLASRIRHPHVVEVLDLGDEAGLLYLVMEWVDGEPLSSVLKAVAGTNAQMPLAIAVRIIMQACAGLHAAHELHDERGEPALVVHRDVSPQNILVTYGGVAKVTDFGIAKATSREGARTKDSTLKGKTLYMAPEQVLGGDIDRRTDIFALGVLLYLMTTGAHPFQAENELASLAKLCAEGPFTPPSGIRKDYPPLLEGVVMRALAKDPSQRFATANEMARALNAALPPSQRESTDESAGDLMKSLFAGAQRARADALAQAMTAADEAALALESGAGAGARAEVAFTGSALLAELQRFRGQVANVWSGRFDASPASLVSGTPSPTAQPVGARRTPLLAVATAVAALATVAAVGLATLHRASSGPAQAPSSSADARSMGTLEPSDAAGTSEHDGGAGLAAADEDDARADASASPTPKPRRPAAPGKGGRSAGANGPPSATGAPSPFVSPIHTSGF
jgi:hypothetical protein